MDCQSKTRRDLLALLLGMSAAACSAPQDDTADATTDPPNVVVAAPLTTAAPLSITVNPPPAVSRIVFQRSLSETWPRFDIYAMDPDGSNLVRLTTEGGAYPVWSPDGSKIAFYSERELPTGIYVMNADGSNQVRVMGSGRLPHIAPGMMGDNLFAAQSVLGRNNRSLVK